MTPPISHKFGTLVDPDAIPVVHYDIGAIEAAAGKLRGLGGKVRSVGTDINSTWQRLHSSYRAPEAPTLLAATAPIAGRADGYASKIEQAGGVLSGFAGEMPGHLRKLEQVRGQAIAFVRWAHAQPHGDWQSGRYDNCLGSAYNEALAGWIADAVKAIEDCEQKYGSQMSRLVDASLLPAPADPGRPSAVNPHDPDRLRSGGDWRDVDLTKWGLPWGGPMTQAQIYNLFGKPSAFQNFLGNFLKSYYLAPLSMTPFLGINLPDGGTDDIHPHPKTDFGWHVMKSAWGGAGKVVLAALPATDLLSPKLHRMNAKTRTAFLDAFLDRKNPSLAGRAGTITANLAGLISPSPADHALADLAHAGEHLAEHGASFGTRLAGRALRAPEWLANGKFVGADVRLTGAGFRKLADHAGLTVPSVRQIVFPHPKADVLDPLTPRAGHSADGGVDAPTAADHRRAADEAMLRGVRERQAILADGAEHSRSVMNTARDQATRVQVEAQRRANELMQQTVREKNRLIAAGDYDGAAKVRDAGATESSRISARGREESQQIYADAKHRSQAIMDEASRRAAERRDQYLRDYLRHAQDYRKALADANAAAAHHAQQRADQAAAAASAHGGGHTPAGNDAGEPLLPRHVRAAWNGLPESARNGILSIVGYENGPVATTGGMPTDWLLGPQGQGSGDQSVPQQVAVVLDYLRHHPRAARELAGFDPADLEGVFVIGGRAAP